MQPQRGLHSVSETDSPRIQMRTQKLAEMKRMMHLFILILLKMLEESKDAPLKQICKKGVGVRGERVETRGKRE